MLHLCDKKYSKSSHIVKRYYNLTVLFYTEPLMDVVVGKKWDAKTLCMRTQTFLFFFQGMQRFCERTQKHCFFFHIKYRLYHSNMLIWFVRSIYYYHCWKQLCC